MLVFQEGGKPENPGRNPWSKVRANNKLNPHITQDWNPTRATWVRDERSHHCAIPAPYTINVR